MHIHDTHMRKYAGCLVIVKCLEAQSGLVTVTFSHCISGSSTHTTSIHQGALGYTSCQCARHVPHAHTHKNNHNYTSRTIGPYHVNNICNGTELALYDDPATGKKSAIIPKVA